MANSKSSIYPIQLKNAELNLNKYDAEIKQYSGFNKNNSPFVGGCLSNVFTKDTALEGATDDNTYIDENGDVYEVKTNGFYRNGVKLEQYSSSDFLSIEKINIPKNTVKVFAEDLFLRIEDGFIYLNDLNISSVEKVPVEIDLKTFLTRFACGVWVENVFVFACWLRSSNSTHLCIRALEKNENGEYEILKRGAQYFSQDIAENIDFIHYSPLSILATKDNDRTYIQISFIFSADRENWVGLIDLFGYYDDESIYLDSYAPSVGRAVANAYASGWTYNSSLANISLSGKYAVSLLSYPRNELVYDYLSFKDNTAAEQRKGTAVRIKLNVKENFENIQINYFNGYVLKNENVLQVLPSPGPSYTYTEQSAFKNVSSNLYENSILKCDGMLNKPNNALKACTLGTPFFVGKENTNYKIIGGATILLNNCAFGVLLNNGEVSGIAACSRNDYSDNSKSNQCPIKILLTNWNTVKEELITYVPDVNNNDYFNINLIYGDMEGDFYILKNTNIPKLRKVSNQLVVNVFSNHNSWFLDKQEFGCYAPGFNISPYTPDNNDRGCVLDVYDSGLYFTAGINEYQLKNNASILLNPFEIYSRNHTNVDVPYYEDVNVYTGITPSKYFRSYKHLNYSNGSMTKIIGYENNDLKDLPFPIDSNGNISYCPSLFSEITNIFGNKLFIKEKNVLYILQTDNNIPVMSYYFAGGIENVSHSFIIQGQYYVVFQNGIYSFQFENGVSGNLNFIVDVSNLQFVGNTPYEALFFSKTNRCLYSFTGANVLNQKQLVDKISEVRQYLYNPATQTVFLITDIGVLFYGLFGVFLLEYTDITKVFLLDNGIVLSNNNGGYRYIKYYLDESDEDYIKQNIHVETCFYGMNNQTVTINDCLYFRLFSEEHEEGNLKVSATTISLRGRKTEETTFRIKASDWDKITHSIYLRYQPKEQRGLGVSFSINSPFKIASLSVGSQPDAILIDKVSKGAINAPSRTSNNDEW